MKILSFERLLLKARGFDANVLSSESIYGVDLLYCIPMVLGSGSFVSLVVEAYARFYFLNCIASRFVSCLGVSIKRFKLLFHGFGGQD